MKEIKQYLVVYWTLTSRTESLEVLFSNIRMYNKKLASCLNKIQKKKYKKKNKGTDKTGFKIPFHPSQLHKFI